MTIDYADLSDYPVCPHCDTEHKDLWDYDFDHGYSTVTIECGHCDRPFLCQQIVTIDYVTGPVGDEEF